MRLPPLGDIRERADRPHRAALAVEEHATGGLDPSLGAVGGANGAELGFVAPAARGLVGPPVIPNNPTRKRRHPFDPVAYRLRNLIERAFCRLKDWRRIATRYDKLAANYAAAVAIAIAVTWWI